MATITSSASRESLLPSAVRFLGAPTIAIRPPRTEPPLAFDDRLIAILDAPCAPYETIADGFARKERELGALLATLPAADARSMQFRLTACKPGDELANKFARLSLERRDRLLRLRPTRPCVNDQWFDRATEQALQLIAIERPAAPGPEAALGVVELPPLVVPRRSLLERALDRLIAEIVGDR